MSRKLNTTDWTAAEEALAEFNMRGSIATADEPDEALALFLRASEDAGLADVTVAFYRQRLTEFFSAMDGVPMADWSREDMTGFISRKDWSPTTIDMTRRAARRFINWSKESGAVVCPDFVGKGRLGPRIKHTRRTPFTIEEMRLLCDEATAYERTSWLDVVVHLAFWAGLPHGDIAELTWSEVDMKRRVLSKTRKKTGQEITVPISAPLFDCLERNRLDDEIVVPMLPVSRPTTVQTLKRAVERAGVSARPSGQGGWHQLRHSLGTALDGVGTPVSVMAMILGHSAESLPMSMRYSHASVENARRYIDRIEAAFLLADGG